MTFLNFFLATDKQKHLIISILLLFVFFLIRKILLKRKWFLIQLSFSLRDVFAIGILKEIVDLFWFWNPEILDLFADMLWIVVLFYVYYLYKEWKNLNESKFIKLEIILLNKIKDKFILLINRLFLFLKIQYKIIFYKRKLLYYIPNKRRKTLLKKSFFEFIHILWYFFTFWIIWILNLIFLIIKIPLLAFYDAINGIVLMIKYSFDFKKSDLKSI
jgi:hypothetical protein